MKECYDPTKAPLGPMGGNKSRKGVMIAHNRKVWARRLRKAKQEQKADKARPLQS
jgi:hypothetical protein